MLDTLPDNGWRCSSCGDHGGWRAGNVFEIRGSCCDFVLKFRRAQFSYDIDFSSVSLHNSLVDFTSIWVREAFSVCTSPGFLVCDFSSGGRTPFSVFNGDDATWTSRKIATFQGGGQNNGHFGEKPRSRTFDREAFSDAFNRHWPPWENGKMVIDIE